MINRIDNIFNKDKIYSYYGKCKKSEFTGWILPNGLTISKDEDMHNHRIIVDTFMNGLSKFNNNLYDIMNSLYLKYQDYYHVDGDIHDSFAVEILGWIQANNQSLIYRGEKWQDKIIFPYLMNYKMNYFICDNLTCQNSKFSELYDDINEILSLGIEKNKNLSLKK